MFNQRSKTSENTSVDDGDIHYDLNDTFTEPEENISPSD